MGKTVPRRPASPLCQNPIMVTARSNDGAGPTGFRRHRGRGAHVPGVGHFNTSVVLELIRRSPGGIERTTIADRSGLSAQTVSNVTRRLILSGVVDEQPGPATGPGKPPSVLTLNADSRYAVGIHLDPAVLSVTVLDLHGCCVASAHQPITVTTPEQVMWQMATMVSEAVQTSRVDNRQVLGLGVATPGPLDAVAGTVHPPRLPGWDHVPLRDTLADLTGFPVLIERDVDAGAIGELWREPLVDNFVFVYYGTGLNSAIALDHQIVRGDHRRAGRLAHLWSGPGGPRCDCGKQGCLGRNLQPDAVVARAHAAGVPVDSLDALSTAAQSDRVARHVLADVGSRLGECIVTVAGFLDLSRVRIGGPCWVAVAGHVLPVILDAAQKAEAAGRCGPLHVHGSADEDIAAAGAASIVLDTAFSPNTEDIILAR